MRTLYRDICYYYFITLLLYFYILLIAHSDYRLYNYANQFLIFMMQILQQFGFHKFKFHYQLQPICSFIKFFFYHFQFIQKILIRLSNASGSIVCSGRSS